MYIVLLLLKSWEYKNHGPIDSKKPRVLLLLKSWEYKNHVVALLSCIWFYCYLNLESTKTQTAAASGWM